MSVDTQEAALGLLSMGHNYLSQPTPSTSSATLNSILTTTSPVIPQKRKQSALEQQESTSVQYIQHQQQQQHFNLSRSPLTEPSPRSNGAESNEDSNDTSTEAVDCICGFAVDDGFSIACDECSRWCHSACFDIAPGGVPEKFACWRCKPRSAIEKERAMKLQRGRLGMDPTRDGDGKEVKQRRRSSPGLERKQRRGAISVVAAGAGAAVSIVTDSSGKKKRRPSIMQQPPTPTLNQQSTPNVGSEEEQVEIDSEPWKDSYVHIAQDIVPNDDTRAKLKRQAAHWRGVTAISTSSFPYDSAFIPSSALHTASPISIKPLSPQSSLNPFLSQNSNPLVLPPAFSLHTTQPIPSDALITPFRSCITPSSSYLADPLNAYAHLGMPKPFVHLMGPPLDVALDARIIGNHGRFARWGCKPNAVLRPVLCDRDDDCSLSFGVFALRDLKPHEEIILGWEWDDGNAIHSLPALLEATDTFPHPPLSSPSTSSAHIVQHLRNQMSNILHALSSTFTTCACGALARDCALTQMAAFVEGHDLSASLRQKRDQSGEGDNDDEAPMGPLLGRKRGFRTRERIPFSGGLGGVEMALEADNGVGFVWVGKLADNREGDSPSPLPGFVVSPSSPSPKAKGKAKAVDEDVDVDMQLTGSSNAGGAMPASSRPVLPINSLITHAVLPPSISSGHPLSEPPDPPDAGGGDYMSIDEPEDRIPPKMRKKWMHRELEARKESSRVENGDRIGLGITFGSEEEQRLMPPPPMPASMDPTTISSATATLKPSNSSPHHQYQSPPRSVVPPSCPPRRLSTSPRVSKSPPILTSPSVPFSATSPLTSFARLSLLSPASLSLAPGQQMQPPTQGQGYSSTASTPTAEVSATEAQNANTEKRIGDEKSSLSMRCSPPGIASAFDETAKDVELTAQTDSCMLEEGEMDTSADVDTSAPPILSSCSQERILSPVMPTVPYSHRQDEDDEVDYSPQSPEASVRGAQSPALLVDDPSPGKPTSSATPTAATPEGSDPYSPQSFMEQRDECENGSIFEIRSPEHTMLSDPPHVSATDSVYGSTTTSPSDSTNQALAHLAVSSPVLISSSPSSTPEPGRQASPPPPPKVKMSLKDFALRKKKQREEQALSQNLQASPVIAPQLPDPNTQVEEQKLVRDEEIGCWNGQNDVEDTIPRKVKVEEDNLFRNKADSGTSTENVNGIKMDLYSIKAPMSNGDLSSTRDNVELMEREIPMTTLPAAILGHSLPVNGQSRTPPMPASLPSRPPVHLPARPTQHLPPNLSNAKNHTRETKQEHIELNLPSLLHRISGPERSISPISPDPTPLASRISQEEDGEIGESPLPTSSRLHSKRDFSFVQRPLSRNGPSYSHSVPTGPRNLPVSSYRPPSLPVPSSSGPPSLLAVPTAPRALRQSTLSHQRSGSGPPPPPPPGPSQSTPLPPPQSGLHGSGSHYIPRGPSADRDREKERAEWDQRHYRGLPPPARRGSGRGNPWGR